MKQLLLLLFLSVVSFSAVLAQRTVSGTITDDNNEPLIGANVIVQGTTVGTITDFDGNFSLEVPDDAKVLEVSYTGYSTQEIELGTETRFDVILSEGILLEEAVVVAQGIQKSRRALGYAVTELGGDQLSQVSEPDPVRALQGKVAGINIVGSGGGVASGTNINIRGNSSLLGNNQPLFVVDGVPFDNTTFETGSFTESTTNTSRSFDLDPNSIEDITVLKGAAAAALYGTRAANGVVLIKTKAAKLGRKKGLEVTLVNSYNFENVSNLPDYQMRYANGNNFLLVNGNFGTWGASFDINEPEWQSGNNYSQIFDAQGNPYFDASGNVIGSGDPYILHPYNNTADGARALSDVYVPFRPTNNADDFFQTGHALENGITISGGSETANFYGGFSRLENEGIVPNNQVERFNLSLGGNAQLDNGIFIGGAVNYVNMDLNSPPTSGLFTGNASVTERITYLPPSLDLANSPIENSEGDQLFYRTDNDNPYYLAEYSNNTSKVDRIYGNLKVGYDITNWFRVEYRAGVNTYRDARQNVLPRSTREIPQGRITTDEIRYEELDGTAFGLLNFDLTSDLQLNATVGHNVNQRTIDRQSFLGENIIVRDIYDVDLTESVVPNGGNYTRLRYHALFADLGFSYKDWLYVNVTGRNEWNSALPEDNRSDLFGGVSTSLVLTDALQIKSNTLNFAKLRASYASVGNDISAYLTSPVFFVNSGLGNNIADFGYPYNNSVNVVSSQATLANSQLKPERTNEWEVGLELGFFRDRIRLDASYYDRLSQDQIVPIDIAPSSGATSRIANLGEVSNKGVELALQLTPIQSRNGKGVTWTNNFVFTRNRNRVEELGDGVDQVFIAGFGNSVRSVHREGEQFGQIFGSVAARHTDGQLLVDPSTGKLIEALDFQVIGNPNKDFTLSVGSEVTWKGFSLGGLFDWSKGGELWSATFNQSFGRGVTEQTVPDHPNGRRITLVIPGVEGDPGTQQAVLNENGEAVPNGVQLTTNDWWFINTFGSAGPDEFSIFDASTVRLREVSLGYTFPKSLLESTFIGSARLSITGRNLWYLAYNMPESLNFDPETTSLGAGNVNSLGGSGATNGSAQGIDFGIIPTTKRFGINLSLTF